MKVVLIGSGLRHVDRHSKCRSYDPPKNSGNANLASILDEYGICKLSQNSKSFIELFSSLPSNALEKIELIKIFRLVIAKI
jgi:hypothetical protein